MALKSMRSGKTYLFQGFQLNCDETYRKRLIAMGFIPGTPFKINRIAPLGDPVLIKIKNSALSLRKQEMSMLRFEEVSP